MDDNEKKSNPTGTGIILACLGAIFLGLWMVGYTAATEGEAIKNQLSELQSEVNLLSSEVRTLRADNAQLARAGKQPAAPQGDLPPPAQGAQGELAVAPEATAKAAMEQPPAKE